MNKKGFIILLLGLILTIIIFLYDSSIIKFIVSLRNMYFDYVFLTFGFLSNIFIIFFFLTTIFLWQENKRKWIPHLVLGFALSVIVSILLKIIIARPRPFYIGIVSVLQIAFYFMRNNFNTWNFSFPALNAVIIFSAIPILNKEFKKFKIVWLIFGVLAVLSGAYFGTQYLSDITGGAMIGYLIGLLLVSLEEKKQVGKLIMKKFGCA